MELLLSMGEQKKTATALIGNYGLPGPYYFVFPVSSADSARGRLLPRSFSIRPYMLRPTMLRPEIHIYSTAPRRGCKLALTARGPSLYFLMPATELYSKVDSFRDDKK